MSEENKNPNQNPQPKVIPPTVTPNPNQGREGFNKAERPDINKGMPADSHPQPPQPKPKK